MSPLTQSGARTRILEILAAQIGKGYSEQSPIGSDGDGHLWQPGEPWPTKFDCSGLVRCVNWACGLDVSDGNAEDQWQQHLGGVVPASDPLLPCDVAACLGSDNVPGYAGHTFVVKTYDAATRSGTMVNAYDTQLGVCEMPFARDETDNGAGLAILGFYRPVATLAGGAPPILEEGSTGSWVEQLQSALNAHGQHPALAVDGVFGPVTYRAVVQFQLEHSVSPADGVVGASTWKALGVG